VTEQLNEGGCGAVTSAAAAEATMEADTPTNKQTKTQTSRVCVT